MDFLKILIIEDDTLSAVGLKNILDNLGYANTFIANDEAQAYEIYMDEELDLAIVDIHLGDNKKDGISIVEKFNKKGKMPIIYLTAYGYRTFRERVKETDFVDYLVKANYNEEQLEIAIDKVLKLFNAQNTEGGIIYEKIDTVYARKNAFNRIAFHLYSEEKIIDIDDIAYCEAVGKHTHVYLKKSSPNKEHDLKAIINLGEYEKRLNEAIGFVRASQKYLINMDFIDKYQHHNRLIALKNGVVLNAAVEGSKRVRRFLIDRFGIDIGEQ